MCSTKVYPTMPTFTIFHILFIIFPSFVTLFSVHLLPTSTKQPPISAFLEQTMSYIQPKPNNVILVNFQYHLHIPAVYLNSAITALKKIDRVQTLYILFNASDIIQTMNILENMVKYIGLVEGANIIMVVPRRPDNEIISFLEKKHIFKTVFIEYNGSRQMTFRDWSWELKGNSKRFRDLVRIPRNINICYFENEPYTRLEHGQDGIELVILSIMGKHNGINITFTKHTEGICRLPESLGMFKHLKDYTCDAIQGLPPCWEFITDYDMTSSVLEDGTLIISPTPHCPRLVGLALLTPDLLLLLLSLMCGITGVSALSLVLKYGRLSDLKYLSNEVFKEMHKIDNKVIKVLVLAPFLLSSIVASGYLQYKLYYSLVSELSFCGVKSIDDVMRRNIIIGVDPTITPTIAKSIIINSSTVNKYITPVTDWHHLDPQRCYLLSNIMFWYFASKFYVEKNGQPMFQLLEQILHHMSGVNFRKGQPLLKEINLGLLRIHESGLSPYLKNAILGHFRVHQIEASRLTLNFSPVRLHEVYWLIGTMNVLWILCIAVWVMEVLIGRLRKKMQTRKYSY